MITPELRAAAERLAEFARIASQGTPGQAPAYHDAAYMAVYNGTPHTRIGDMTAVSAAVLRADLDRLQIEVDAAAHLEAGVRGTGKPADVYPDWVYEAREAIRRQNANPPPWLPDLLAALGWQGGTIHNALNVVRRLAAVSKGEHAAATYREAALSRDGKPDGSREDLERCAVMLDTYAPELFPAAENGQIDFARAMMESVADVIRAYVARVYEAKPEGGAA